MQDRNQTGSHIIWSFLHKIDESHNGYNLQEENRVAKEHKIKDEAFLNTYKQTMKREGAGKKTEKIYPKDEQNIAKGHVSEESQQNFEFKGKKKAT